MDRPAFVPAHPGGVRERAAAVLEAVVGVTNSKQRETLAHFDEEVPQCVEHRIAVRAVRPVMRRRGRLDLRDCVGRVRLRRVRGVEGVADRRVDGRLVPARERGGAACAVAKHGERGGVVVVGGDEVDAVGVRVELEPLAGQVPGLRRIGAGPARPFDERGCEVDAVRHRRGRPPSIALPD